MGDGGREQRDMHGGGGERNSRGRESENEKAKTREREQEGIAREVREEGRHLEC